ncbi:hypothetical protein AX16_007536 [Volvariella volvacea WC 439]|nr:hypothetical protein AX16_007536 [Volvariella volvacea WC 439]
MTTHSAPEQLLPAISQNHYTPQDMTLPPLRPVGLQNGLHDGLIIPDPLPPSPYPDHYPVLPPHTLDSSGSNHSSGVHQTSPHQHSSQYSPHFPQYSQTPQSRLHSELDAPPNTPIATQFPSVYPDIGSSTSSDEAGEYLRKQLGIAPGLPVDLWSLPDPPPGQRPSYTLPVLVKLAIYGSENKRLTLQGIYDAIAERFEYYRKQKKNAWKHSIRHNLSLNKVFRRAYRAVVDTDAKGDRGGFWVLDFSEGEGYKRDRRRTRKSKQQSTTSGIRGRRRRTPDESESESEQDRDNLEIKVPSPQQKRYSFRPYRYAQRRHPRLRRSQFSPSPPAQNDYNAQSSSIPNSSDAQPHDPFQLQYPPSEAETSYGPAPSSQYTTANFSTVQSVPTNFANPSPRPAVDNISPLPLNFTYIPVSSIPKNMNRLAGIIRLDNSINITVMSRLFSLPTILARHNRADARTADILINRTKSNHLTSQ